ncbi:MAG: right-handed parallel beta-helix repeat-containing protein [Cyanobacteria bacterium P01_A01_bin.123]
MTIPPFQSYWGISWAVLAIAGLSMGQSALALPERKSEPIPSGPTPDYSIPPQVHLNYEQPSNESLGFIGLEGFLPLWQTADQSLTFINGRLSAASASNAIASFHLGHRRRLGEVVVGGYGGLDLRGTPYQTIPQLGFGIEVLGGGWEVHMNGYLPLGQARSQISSASQATNPRFVGNQLLIDSQELIQSEVALGGLDLEAGFQLARFGNSGGSLWGSTGVFYVDGSEVDGQWGGRLRLDYRLPNQLRLGLGIEQDLQGNGQVSLSFRLPLNSPVSDQASQTVSSRDTPVWQRAAEPLVRRSGGWLTVLSESRTVSGLIAINPETGTAYQFRHVDPTHGTTTGHDAAAETPRDTVANAVGLAIAGDIVYVQSGHAGSGFTIPAGVAVRSVGPVQMINTQFGTVQLPGSGNGLLPTLSDTVTLSNNTVLSGFAIAPPTGNLGIFGSDIDTVQLEYNQIATSGNNAGGIRLTRADGSISLLNNSLTTTGASTSFPNGAQAIQISWAGTAESIVTIANNAIATIGNNADGIYLQTDDGARVTAAIADNRFTQTGGGGIEIDADDTSQFNLSVSQNQINATGSSDDGIYIDVNGSAEAAIAISNNTLTTIGGAIANTNGEAIEIDTEADAQATVTIENNQINTTSGDGIFLNLDDRSQMTATLTQNTIQNTDDEAVHVDAEDANTRLMLMMTGNHITTVNDDGIFLDIDDDAQVTAILRSNTVVQAAQDSFDIDQNSSQSLCLLLAGNSSAIAADSDFELDPNSSIFQIVSLATVSNLNIGNFTFETGIANFTSVSDCP